MPVLPACSTYRFDINPDEAWPPLIVATGGPGLGWEFALNEAVRQHARRRGDVGWRGMRGMVRTTHQVADVQDSRIVAHVEVATTRHVDPLPPLTTFADHAAIKGHPDLLDVWVRLVGADDREEGDSDDAATARGDSNGRRAAAAQSQR